MAPVLCGLEGSARHCAARAPGPSWKPETSSVSANGELIAALTSDWSETAHEIEGRVREKAAEGGVALSEQEIMRAVRDSVRALMLIRSHRVRGHLAADLDPLRLTPPTEHPELQPESYGFTQADYDRPIYLDKVLGLETATLRQIVEILRRTYCGPIGIEFMHISTPEEKGWLQERIEGVGKEVQFTLRGKEAILQKLIDAEGFEKYLDKKYTGTKRFGLDGAEAMVPALEQVIKRGGNLGVREIVIGMPHRGRLNVLANVMGKPYRAIFHEFKGGSAHPEEVEGSGDVKYHLGTSSDRVFDGNEVHLSLTANPSHLEAVDPVVLGKVRAKQDQHDDTERAAVLPLLLHGDASFAGQGVVAECLGLSGLRGHRTGGSIHFIINNQIGFTTAPRFGRSSPYPSDVARMVEAPIFHVNGDDPEAVTHVAKVATEFRQRFHKPVVIDMFCYRRHGHNEGDEPSFTQPLMYKRIRQQRPVVDIYAEQLVKEGLLDNGEIQELRNAARTALDEEFEAAEAYRPNRADWLDGAWAGIGFADEGARRGKTEVPAETLREVSEKINAIPEHINAHKTVRRIFDNRRKGVEAGEGIDWATAESLAFATLLDEGFPVRLSGQDSERGTFSQRHAVIVDQETEEHYRPLNHISQDQARFEVINSMLSEFAVLGFEYGYSLAEPNALVLWEAQFGDFVNGAQVTIDQFITSGERKWLRMSGLVMLLPHGYEGQGPGAFIGKTGAIPADVRGGQHTGRELHDASELFPYPAPSASPRVPQALDPDDPEIAAASQARHIQDREIRPRVELPSCAVGRWRDGRERRADARRRRPDQARCSVLRKSLFRPHRRAREARHRRYLSDAHRAALSVSGARVDYRAVPLQERRDALVSGRAQEYGRMVFRGTQHRMGSQPHRRGV